MVWWLYFFALIANFNVGRAGISATQVNQNHVATYLYYFIHFDKNPALIKKRKQPPAPSTGDGNARKHSARKGKAQIYNSSKASAVGNVDNVSFRKFTVT